MSHLLHASRKPTSIKICRYCILSKNTVLRGCIRLSSTDETYQFLQRSKVPTMHFQASLPRLPIPELSKSCQRYLAAMQPLASSDEYSHTKRVVQEFERGEGKVLHEELLQRDQKNKHTSYISEPWFNMYLKSRIPLVINFNPFMAFKPDTRPEYNKQIIRATNMLISSLRFAKSLRSNTLEPEVYHLNPPKSDTPRFRTITRLLPSSVSWYGAYLFKAFPLDMSQFPGLFNGTRIPQPSKDRILNDPTAKHMLVIKNGRFYVFDAMDRDGNLLSPSLYHAILDYIDKLPTTLPAHALGYLTTTDRETWAAARQHLEQNGNRDQLRSIDTAMFALVLDNQTFDDNIVKGASGMLHGPAYNRWFDKSVQLLLSRDATAWLNFEHSWGDGVAVLRYFNEIYADSTKKPCVHPHSVPATNVDVSQLVKELEFNLDERSKKDIQLAKQSYESLTDSLLIDAAIIGKEYLNRDYLKKQKLSPDSVLQLAFQLAYYREHGKTAASYEACSTSAFRHGRTETVRPASVATLKFTEAVCRRQPPPANELRAMMQECSKHHGQLTKEAAMGQGFDRHFFVMKEIALAKDGKIPLLYQDPVYQRANYYHLSSSTLSGDAFLVGGFGPVVEDGYGIAYGYMDAKNAGTLISSYKKHRNATRFIECIEDSMDTLCDVLKATGK